MVQWHRSRSGDLALRAGGLSLCALSYVAVARLASMHVPPMKAGLTSFVLAALGFVAASAGSLLLTLGRRLFDEVEVSARWRHRVRVSISSLMEQLSMNNIKEPALLVVGRDADGSWTVRESAGMLLGRFASAEAARRFAQAERAGQPQVAIASSAGAVARIDGRLSLRIVEAKAASGA
ncbi:hypothetical protein [Sphingomonas sp. BK069]|uniref:hypothetical protein n=1 Tax=Sphingomonas sp. BK069 TaxID=2586979 RepID=UPI0016114E20|nr:hypothetical protein [Sphingomonas sp. BK069]MBB3349963.1 hypothetical protein [Sphingomonas sp. BK069]